MHNKITSIVCILMLLGGLAHSQTSNFVNYGVEHGLIQSQVQTLNQDRNGHLWIGTIGGVSRYNGKSFVSYNRKSGLAEDWITASCIDSSGNIWFGHWGGGVSIYEMEEDSIRDLKFETYSKYKSITDIEQDNEGNMWFATENAGIFKYDVEQGKVLTIDGLGNNNITSMCVDKSGRLWAGSSNGISIVYTNNNEVVRILTQENGFPASEVSSITLAYDDEIWIGTRANGIIRMKVNKEIPENIDPAGGNYFNILNTSNGLATDNINLLYEDSEHNLWIGTEGKGVILFMPVNYKPGRTGFTEGEYNRFSNKLELKYYEANVFLEDRESNIWMGTDIGLNQYKGELFRVYNHNDNLVNNMVWCVTPDHRGEVWFGTNEGVSRFQFPVTASGKKLYNNPVVTNYSTVDGLPENVILAVYEDDGGNMWFGTESKGVARMDVAGRFSYLTTANGMGSNTVFSISSDKKGNIWFATRNGASMYDPVSAEVKNFTDADGLGGNKVYSLFKDSKGNLWMGILGGYLTRYDGHTFKTFGEAEGIDQKFILSIAEDKDGNLWMGSYGGGIYKYDGKQFNNYTTRDGLGSDSPHFLECDEEGNVWIGTNHGLEKFDQQEERFVKYGEKEGFSGIETNQNASARDNAGNIWFGTIRGAVKLSPGSGQSNTVEPITTIDGLKVFLKETPFPADNIFSYNQNHLSFRFTGVCLSNPDQVSYSYMLQDFDKDWSPPTREDNITYSNLPPGNYTLMVKAANDDGVWNKEPVTYSFTVTPPFYMTTWFYTLSGILVITIIWTFIKVRERSLRKQQRILEKEVETRTKELQVKTDMLNKKNQQITDSITYAQKIQEAILPSKEFIKEQFPESFILYKPKDIVSGDFYWMDKKGNKVLIGAVDCTGHGVPGAFMSLIGHNLLDKVVNELHITKPAEILNKLSEEVVKTFRQKEKDSEVKDGMDLAICSIDTQTMQLEFAGAYNPLYIVRKKELLEIKGDRIPIGKLGNKASGEFINHTQILEKGDSIYLFSDGFPDQKGGPKNKKFYYPPFKQLLVEINELNMKQQEQKLNDTILGWMSSYEQIDDILVFGIRL